MNRLPGMRDFFAQVIIGPTHLVLLGIIMPGYKGELRDIRGPGLDIKHITVLDVKQFSFATSLEVKQNQMIRPIVRNYSQTRSIFSHKSRVAQFKS